MKKVTRFISPLQYSSFVREQRLRWGGQKEKEDQAPSDCQQALFNAAQIKMLSSIDKERELKNE
jgi:hypothetical protein